MALVEKHHLPLVDEKAANQQHPTMVVVDMIMISCLVN
jgi:hypothetical protein